MTFDDYRYGSSTSWLLALLTEEPADLGDYSIDGSIGELRVDRQGEDVAGHSFAVAQPGWAQRNAVAIGWMQMHRNGIMNAGTDRRGAQVLAQAIALRTADHILMKHVAGIRRSLRQPNRQTGETIIIAGGDRLAAPVIGVEPRQLDPEDRRLDRVEARVDARAGADVTFAPTIFANFPRGL